MTLVPNDTNRLSPGSDAYDIDVVAVGADPVGLTVANTLAHHGVRFRALEQRTGSKMFGADDLQQLAVAYSESPLSEDHFPALSLSQRKAPKAGDRAPDTRVIATGSTTTSLFGQIYNPDGHSWGWCLLAFDGRDRTSRPDLARALTAVSSFPWVHPRLVLAQPEPDEDTAGAPCLFDLDGEAHAAYGLTGTPALVLVRPDEHIALRASADRADLLQQYCQRLTLATTGTVTGRVPVGASA